MFVSSVNHLAFMFIAFFALFVNLSYYFDFDLKIFFDSYKILRPSQLHRFAGGWGKGRGGCSNYIWSCNIPWSVYCA